MRASLSLERAVRAWALIAGRSYVVPADVERLFEPVVGHRLVLGVDFAVDAEALDREQLGRVIWEAVSPARRGRSRTGTRNASGRQ